LTHDYGPKSELSKRGGIKLIISKGILIVGEFRNDTIASAVGSGDAMGAAAFPSKSFGAKLIRFGQV